MDESFWQNEANFIFITVFTEFFQQELLHLDNFPLVKERKPSQH